MCEDRFANDGDLFDCDVTGTTKCAKPLYVVKPTLPSLGSLIADGLTKVKTIWLNDDGAIDTNILDRLPLLCCGRGLLLEVLCSFLVIY